MNKKVKIVGNVIMWILTAYCIWSFIMIDGIAFKVIEFITAILICPLVNQKLARRFSRKHPVAVCISICLLAIFINFLTVALSPVEVNEKEVLRESVEVLKERYADYDKLDMKDFKMSVDDEEKQIQTISVTLSFEATKDGTTQNASENLVLYFDKSTGKYLTEYPAESEGDE